jgi:hypothetical protein
MVAHRSTGPLARLNQRTKKTWASLFATLCALVLVLVWQSPAHALNVSGGSTPVTGNATWFTSLGAPYGGCGLPQAQLDTQNFLALNVFNSPGDYGSITRPIPASMASVMGMFDNGLNCGRFVQVNISDYCTGTNDGAQNQPFCRNGSWTADKYNGATLTFVVADSCGDSNAWCRDDPYHVDLAQASLNQFLLNGVPVGDMAPNHWNNRHVTWQFVPAPNYTGDINIGFLQSAQVYWPAIAISHLANGIHGVRYLSGGAWQTAAMNSDMGDDYIIGPTTAGGSQYQIQVIDASDTPINGGRIYSFSLPASCGSSCGQAYTAAAYTTSSGPGGGTPSPSPSPSTSPTGTPGNRCSVTSSVTNSWSGGEQLQFTVANGGTAPITGWTVKFAFAGSQTIANSWNSVVTQTGAQVTALNANYNGTVPPAGSTTWGMVANGSNQPLGNLTCS